MPAIQERVTAQLRARSVQVTGRQVALPAQSVHDRCCLDPQNGAGSRVALLVSSPSARDLFDTPAVFTSVDTVVGLQGVQRLRCEEYNGYPLRRPLLVVFN